MKPSVPGMVAALLAALTFAGCVDEAPEEIELPDARLEFDGSGSGEHEDQTDCDEQALFDADGEVADGSVLVQITDGGGNQVFEREFEGDIEEAEEIPGASGEWTLKAQRSGDDLVGDEFNGRYDFRLTC